MLITPGLNINKLLAKDENSYMRGEVEVKREWRICSHQNPLFKRGQWHIQEVQGLWGKWGNRLSQTLNDNEIRLGPLLN